MNLALPTPSNIKDFLIGNLVSLQVIQSVPDGFACATNLASLKNNTKQAFSLLISGHLVDALHLVEQTINQTVGTCEAANAEGKALFENFIRIVLDPEFIPNAVQRVKDNQLTILEDLAEGLEDLNNGSFFNAGVTLGKIPHLILSGPDANLVLIGLMASNNISTPLLDFLRGFLDAVKVWDNVPHGLECFDDIATLKDNFDQVIALLKQFKILEAIELLQQTITSDFLNCQNTITESVQLFQSFLQTIHQAGFIDLAKQRILGNVVTLLEDLENGVKGIGAKDYYGAGRALGHIPHLVLSGPDQ